MRSAITPSPSPKRKAAAASPPSRLVGAAGQAGADVGQDDAASALGAARRARRPTPERTDADRRRRRRRPGRGRGRRGSRWRWSCRGTAGRSWRRRPRRPPGPCVAQRGPGRLDAHRRGVLVVGGHGAGALAAGGPERLADAGPVQTPVRDVGAVGNNAEHGGRLTAVKDLLPGRALAAFPPGVEVGPRARPGPAADVPIAGSGRRRKPEMHVARFARRVPGTADPTDLLPRGHLSTRLQPGRDGGEVAAVVPDPVAPDDAHPQPTPQARGCRRRGPSGRRRLTSSSRPSVTATSTAPQGAKTSVASVASVTPAVGHAAVGRDGEE